jgi:hypothetical protein
MTIKKPPTWQSKAIDSQLHRPTLHPHGRSFRRQLDQRAIGCYADFLKRLRDSHLRYLNWAFPDGQSELWRKKAGENQ